MAVFVDLEDDDVDLPQQSESYHGIKPVWAGFAPAEPSATAVAKDEHETVFSEHTDREEAAHEPAVEEVPISMTVALGCYP